ncbi:MAG: hypothetical protein AABY28_00230 [Candidatus Omnitrophota bacterium]
MGILKPAIDAAKKNNISTLVIASTTGNTALKLLELVKGQNLQMIVVTHDEGKPTQERRFNEDIRKALLANKAVVYTHNPRMVLLRKIIGKVFGRLGFPRWYVHLSEVKEKYGTGVKVCHIIVQMLREGGVLGDEKVVAIAGTKTGADSAAIFSVATKNKWPVQEEVIKAG